MHEKLQYRDSYAMAAFVDAAKVFVFFHRFGEKFKSSTQDN